VAGTGLSNNYTGFAYKLQLSSLSPTKGIVISVKSLSLNIKTAVILFSSKEYNMSAQFF